MTQRAALALCAGLALAGTAAAEAPWEAKAEGSIRVAVFNVGMVRKGAGLLAAEIEAGSSQVDAVAEIILRVRPDILLLIKFDRDPAHRPLAGFAGRLRAGVAGLPGLDFPFLYQGPVNAGLPSGLDLDGDGRSYGPRDAFGYGRFPGQHGMALLSRLPIDFDRIRSFQRFRWAAMPDADRPVNPDGTPFHTDAVWQALRLSSASHWDVPVALPGGQVLHLLAAHATPPVFDGPEDFNGRRNADEIRLLGAIAAGAGWPEDDRGRRGGLEAGEPFVIAGDLNSDPFDGDSRHEAIAALLDDPLLQDPAPASAGGAEASDPGHAGPAALDTADFRDGAPGNLRVDYVLPSGGLRVTGAGVFWPVGADPLARLVAGGKPPASSDHRLVWVDVVAE